MRVQRKIDLVLHKNSNAALLVFISFFYFFMYISSWWPLQVQNVGGGHLYLDLKFVFNYVNCESQNIDFDPEDCAAGAYHYGVLLLWIIKLINLTQISIGVLGAIVIISLILIFSYIVLAVRPKTFLSRSLVFLYITSPVLWLLFERGNIDWLVFILLFLGAITFSTKFEILGVLLIALSALIKFYTLPILLLIPLIVKSRLTRLISLTSFLALLPLIAIGVKNIGTFPYPMFSAFGSPVSGLWLNFFSWRFNLGFKLSNLECHILGLSIYVTFTLILLKNVKLHNKFGLRPVSINNNKIFPLYFIFTSSFLITYIAGMNFDYRLIYLIASLILCYRINHGLFTNKSFQILALASLWFTYFFLGFTGVVPVLLMISGNVAQGIIASILTCDIIFKFRKNGNNFCK